MSVDIEAPANGQGHISAPGHPDDAAAMRRRIKAIFIGSVGNLFEW